MELLAKVSDMSHCIIEKEFGNDPVNLDFNDFKVCQKVVLNIIWVLKKTLPDIYGHVPINEDNFNALLINGNVFDQILIVNKSNLSQHITHITQTCLTQEVNEINHKMMIIMIMMIVIVILISKTMDLNKASILEFIMNI